MVGLEKFRLDIQIWITNPYEDLHMQLTTMNIGLLEENPYQRVEGLAAQLNANVLTVSQHLKAIGKVKIN